MKTATKATKTTLQLVNVCCRILFFYFFWLASFDDGGTFTNRELAFINEMWAWQQQAYSKINIYTDSECPSEWVLLSTFNWPGTKQYYDATDQLVPAQAAQKFNKWTTTEYKTAFILCGYQIQYSFVDQALLSETCEERQMKDCGITNQSFCVDTNMECPINGFEIVFSEGEISVQTTNINTKQDQMPLSLVRIDSYTPCATNNDTNTEANVEYDENLDQTPQKCTTLDQEYIEVNSILDSLYFDVNNASNLFYSDNGTKTLYYKSYPYWSNKCYGSHFLLAQDQSNILNQYKNLEYVNFVLVVVYLLVCNYLIPMVPFIFRCVETLTYKNLIYVDYIFRILLSAVMTYLSFLSLGYGKALEDNLDQLWGEACIKDEETTYGRFAEQLDLQKALDIVAVTFSFVLWAIEGSLLWILGCQQTINKCRRAFKRQKIKQQMHLEQLEQSDIIQLN